MCICVCYSNRSAAVKCLYVTIQSEGDDSAEKVMTRFVDVTKIHHSAYWGANTSLGRENLKNGADFWKISSDS